VCYKCHPFYTGEQRIIDTEGQVDRFVKKLDARATFKKKEDERQAQRQSPTVAIVDLNLGARAEAALTKAGFTTAGEIIEKLQQGGDEALLSLDGFGHKNLVDTKKRLRARGFEVPADAAPAEEAAPTTTDEPAA
jgi:large subunit ribosomal protein L31